MNRASLFSPVNIISKGDIAVAMVVCIALLNMIKYLNHAGANYCYKEIMEIKARLKVNDFYIFYF